MIAAAILLALATFILGSRLGIHAGLRAFTIAAQAISNSSLPFGEKLSIIMRMRDVDSDTARCIILKFIQIAELEKQIAQSDS